MLDAGGGSNGHGPLDQMELQGGDMGQAWTSNGLSRARQERGEPAAGGDTGMQPARPGGWALRGTGRAAKGNGAHGQAAVVSPNWGPRLLSCTRGGRAEPAGKGSVGRVGLDTGWSPALAEVEPPDSGNLTRKITHSNSLLWVLLPESQTS